MKLHLLLLSLLSVADASSPSSQLSTSVKSHRSHHRFLTPAFSTSSSQTSVTNAKLRLQEIATRLNTESTNGVFLSSSESKRELKKAVAELEALCDAPTSTDLMVGDWKLLCTTNSNSLGITPNVDEKPDFFKKWMFPSNPVQSALRQKFDVVQRIRSMSEDDESDIDRVDNVVEIVPLTAEDIFKGNSVPDFVKRMNLNPLNVSNAKVTLIHKANVESVEPVLRTRIGLQSVVLTVAGSSQYLEPDGADVLGLNVPLGEFLNAGSFDTTYVDEDIRVSRGTIGVLDQLRVFVRKNKVENADDVDVIVDAEEKSVEETTSESLEENEINDKVEGESGEKSEDSEERNDESETDEGKKDGEDSKEEKEEEKSDE